MTARLVGAPGAVLRETRARLGVARGELELADAPFRRDAAQIAPPAEVAREQHEVLIARVVGFARLPVEVVHGLARLPAEEPLASRVAETDPDAPIGHDGHV